MTAVGRLRLEVQVLKAQVAALMAAQPAARPARPKRAPQAGRDINAREKLWAKYLVLEMQHGHGRMKLTKLAFAVRHRLNPDEFCRWFSASDRRGVPDGSGPDRNHRRALETAIAELESGKNQSCNASLNSHGRPVVSQDSRHALQ
jgi:hypothetical protein